MKTEPLPRVIYRAHAQDEGPLEPSMMTGGWRWDDYRRPARFHMLYTADSATGALIEKLQRFRGGDDEAIAILAKVTENAPDPVRLQHNLIPASILRAIAISELRVQDDSARVIDPLDLTTIHELHALAPRHAVEGFQAPPSRRDRIADALAEVRRRALPMFRGVRREIPKLPKPADLIGSDYALPQRASVIIFESHRDVAGIVSLSSLDNPRSSAGRQHLNFNLYRDVPENGSGLRAYVRRQRTELVVNAYNGELDTALLYLGARPELP
jgi:hypothetical protein